MRIYDDLPPTPLTVSALIYIGIDLGLRPRLDMQGLAPEPFLMIRLLCMAFTDLMSEILATPFDVSIP